MKDSRLYSFVNFYLSPIQAGIQTGHTSDEISLVYMRLLESEKYNEAKKVHEEWLSKHKTYIVLNGGDNAEILRIMKVITDLGHALNLPFGCFQEPGLGDIMTCAAIIVPEKYFEAKKYYAPVDTGGSVEVGYKYAPEDGEAEMYYPDTPAYQLIELIKSKPLFK